MSRPLIISAKVLRRIVRLAGGHGSALPGLLIEKVDTRFLSRTLGKLPLGVIVVTGTNGKTTTTHMIVHILRSQELRVLTNESGSNLTRGLISTVVEKATKKGTLAFDIAVLEIDEANAPLFTAKVPSRVLVALNVMRDQLDRYGEIDNTAALIAKAAANAHLLVVNGDDVLLAGKTLEHPHQLRFGLAAGLRKQVSTEENLYGGPQTKKTHAKDGEVLDIRTTDSGVDARFEIEGEHIHACIPVGGTHNSLNALAAIITTKELLPKAPLQTLADSLKDFRPAFGRGETIKLGGRTMTIGLIKNPSGFTQNIQTFVRPNLDAILIIINDRYADGRDVSWLWDVQIDKLRTFKGSIFVAGTRRYDMILRLKYEHIPFEVIDAEDAPTIMDCINAQPWQYLLALPTYTAMLALRKELAQAQGGKHLW